MDKRDFTVIENKTLEDEKQVEKTVLTKQILLLKNLSNSVKKIYLN